MSSKGLVIVYTGDGKGKTTAALGLCLRALGWGKRVCVLQFFKSPEFDCGEKRYCKEQGIELHSLGIGYSWTASPKEQLDCLKKAWAVACEKLADSQYDVLVLDEINIVFQKKELDTSLVFTEGDLINRLEKRPVSMNVVLTGRGAGKNLIEYADLVTEMNCIKHPFQQGIKAKEGIEY